MRPMFVSTLETVSKAAVSDCVAMAISLGVGVVMPGSMTLSEALDVVSALCCAVMPVTVLLGIAGSVTPVMPCLPRAAEEERRLRRWRSVLKRLAHACAE